MKKYLLLALLLINASLTHAQELAKRTNYIADAIMERFTVLRTDKRIREGEFTATFKNTTVAKGTYKNNARTSDWNFYNTKGKLIQTYNYTNNTITFLDSTDNANLHCFMENVQPTDKVTAAIKIGGSCYGMLPLVYRDELTKLIRDDNPGIKQVTLTHQIYLNDKGMVINHKVTASINGVNRSYNLDDTQLNPDITAFTPAQLNNKPVPCVVSMVTYSTFYGAVVKTF